LTCSKSAAEQPTAGGGSASADGAPLNNMTPAIAPAPAAAIAARRATEVENNMNRSPKSLDT
jgi:hypothetical protein